MKLKYETRNQSTKKVFRTSGLPYFMNGLGNSNIQGFFTEFFFFLKKPDQRKNKSLDQDW